MVKSSTLGFGKKQHLSFHRNFLPKILLLVSDKIRIFMTATLATPEKLMTVEEYLAWEEKALEKHEFRNGKLRTITRGTPSHGFIALRLAALLLLALQKKGLKNPIGGSDVKIRMPAFDRFVYPDAVIIDEPPAYYPHKKGGITNPILIVEVLSEATEIYDRGKKFEQYKSLQSFREYVLVSQKEAKIEVFYRETGDSDWWQIQTFKGMDATAQLQSIGVEIKLQDVFTGIDFDNHIEELGNA